MSRREDFNNKNTPVKDTHTNTQKRKDTDTTFFLVFVSILQRERKLRFNNILKSLPYNQNMKFSQDNTYFIEITVSQKHSLNTIGIFFPVHRHSALFRRKYLNVHIV